MRFAAIVLALTVWAHIVRTAEEQPPDLQERAEQLCTTHGGVAVVRPGYTTQSVYCVDGDSFKHAKGRWHYIKIRKPL